MPELSCAGVRLLLNQGRAAGWVGSGVGSGKSVAPAAGNLDTARCGSGEEFPVSMQEQQHEGKLNARRRGLHLRIVRGMQSFA